MTQPILEVNPAEWDTPALHYPDRKVGVVEITHQKYPRGYYLMEGVGGHVMWHNKSAIPYTILKIRGKQWMVDDPLHWTGMQLLANKCEGNVLVGGLGLGLIVHALSRNPKVKTITVLEREPDVVALVQPLLPKKGPHIRIFETDFYTWLRGRFYGKPLSPQFDSVIIDFWVGEGDLHKWAEMMGAIATIKQQNGDHPVYVWGMSDPAFNPTVTEDAKVKTAVLELHRSMKGRR
jgi:hypothetical protein